MQLPVPALALDTRTYVARARRLRGTVTANLIRDLIRWVSVAAS